MTVMGKNNLSMKCMRAFLKRDVHVSWHLTIISAGLLAGTALLAVLPHEIFTGLWVLVVAFSLLLVVLVNRCAAMLIFALGGGMFLGFWVGANEQQKLSLYEAYQGEEVTLEAVVADDTSRGQGGDQRFELSDARINNQEMHGEIWASTLSDKEIKRGDIIILKGEISEGFGNFPASMQSASVVDTKRPHPGDIGLRVRDWFTERIRQAIPEPEATLGASFLTGHREALPESLSERLGILSLTHVVVASGFHLTIVVRFMRRLLTGISKYLTTFISGSMIGGFLLVTGFSTSMIRASLVAGLSLLAWYYGRNIHPIKLLLIIAAATVIIKPAFIWGDIGWYLSFAAFTGVIILAPLLNSYFFGDYDKPGVLRHILVGTTSAQITTFPIIVLAMGQYSPLALLANLLVLPIVQLAMLLTFAGGLVAAATPSLAAVAGFPAYWVLLYITNVTSWLASLPMAYNEIDFNIAKLAISHVIILILIIFLRYKTGHRLGNDNAIH